MSEPRRPLICLLLATLLWPVQLLAMQLDETLETAVVIADAEAAEPADAAAQLSSTPEPAVTESGAAQESIVSESERQAITRYTRAAIGKPYRYGATQTAPAYDCSSLVQRAYQAAGLAVPRASQQQLESGTPVPINALRAGDLLFYRFKRNDPESLHVVVYMGDGHAIHASVSHRQVREVDISRGLWSSRLIGARRLL